MLNCALCHKSPYRCHQNHHLKTRACRLQFSAIGSLKYYYIIPYMMLFLFLARLGSCFVIDHVLLLRDAVFLDHGGRMNLCCWNGSRRKVHTIAENCGAWVDYMERRGFSAKRPSHARGSTCRQIAHVRTHGRIQDCKCNVFSRIGTIYGKCFSNTRTILLLADKFQDNFYCESKYNKVT